MSDFRGLVDGLKTDVTSRQIRLSAVTCLRGQAGRL